VVISQKGIGTTMRIVLARADEPGPAALQRAALTEAGD
jgi:hypothetical protein